MNNKPLIIVLTRNYSTGLGVIRMLGSKGYTIDLIGSAFKSGELDIAASSKYVRNYVEVVSKKVKDEAEDEELINEILKYVGTEEQKPIIIPTDDYTASIMDLARDRLENDFIMPYIVNGKAGDLVHLMNKATQAEMAKEVGFNVAKNWKISLREEIIIPEDMVYPCFVKPIRSISGYKTEMKICNDENELKEHLELLKEKFSNRDIFVQEFLEIDDEIASAGLNLDTRTILPAVIKKQRIGKHGRGVTLTGSLVPFETLGEDIVRMTNELLSKFHYFGLFGMEFALVKDKIYFNEVNLRSAGEGFAYYLNGSNLPYLYVQALEGNMPSLEEDHLKEYNKTFIYDKIAYEDYQHGYMSKEELDECLNSVDYMVLQNADDPTPGELFLKKNDEIIERNERRARHKQQREDCINQVMEATSLSREEVEEHLNKSRETCDVTYKDYVKYEFYNIPFEEQQEKYKDILARREKSRAARENCIKKTMEKTEWTYEEAKENIKESRRLCNITYRDYIDLNFYRIPLNKHAERYAKYLEDKENERKARKKCLNTTMEKTGWDKERAEKEIDLALLLNDIDYETYLQYEFYKMRPDEQRNKWRKIKYKLSKLETSEDD